MRKETFPLSRLFRGFPPVTPLQALQMANYHARKERWTTDQREMLAARFLKLLKAEQRKGNLA